MLPQVPITDKARTKFITICISHVLSSVATRMLTAAHKAEIVNKNKDFKIFLLKAHIPSNSVHILIFPTQFSLFCLDCTWTIQSVPHSYRQFRYEQHTQVYTVGVCVEITGFFAMAVRPLCSYQSLCGTGWFLTGVSHRYAALKCW